MGNAEEKRGSLLGAARGVIAVILAIAPRRMRLHAILAGADRLAAGALVIVFADRREAGEVCAGLVEVAEVAQVQAVHARGDVHALVGQLVELRGSGMLGVVFPDAANQGPAPAADERRTKAVQVADLRVIP